MGPEEPTAQQLAAPEQVTESNWSNGWPEDARWTWDHCDPFQWTMIPAAGFLLASREEPTAQQSDGVEQATDKR